MNKASLTYSFDENEIGYAILEGKVIASHHDLDELEKLAAIEVAELAHKPKKAKKTKRVIVNPSGLQGEILGAPRPGLFGEEVSVRFANGQIRHIEACFIEPDTSPVEKVAGTEESFISKLNSRIASSVVETAEGLTARLDELDKIKIEASTLLSAKPSFEEEQELNSIVVAAEHEAAEIKEAIDHIVDDRDNKFKAPQPYGYNVVEQESLGKEHSWLDHTVQDMIDESKGTDYEKMLSEGPALLTSDLDTGVLADTVATQAVASNYIRSKTAMIQDEAIEDYRKTFIARVEDARKTEYKERLAGLHKEATTKQRDLSGVPDAGLFM